MEDLRRLYWPLGLGALCLVIALLVGASYVNLGAWIFKFLLAGTALGFAHICRVKVWPYVRMGQLWERTAGNPSPVTDAAWIIGVFYFVVEIVKAVVGAF